MTSLPEKQSLRQTFERALDGLKPRQSDAIVVLRCCHDDENSVRVDRGVRLMLQHWAKVLIMTLDDSTKTEAQRVVRMADVMEWGRFILVTHRYHSYRAYLTLLRAMKLQWGEDHWVDIYVSAVPSGLELSERQKIEQYSGVGDCATYEEGLEYMKRYV